MHADEIELLPAASRRRVYWGFPSPSPPSLTFTRPLPPSLAFSHLPPPSPRYAEFLERALTNGVLGTQRGEEPGAYLYFMPLGTYVSKAAPQACKQLPKHMPTRTPVAHVHVPGGRAVTERYACLCAIGVAPCGVVHALWRLLVLPGDERPSPSHSLTDGIMIALWWHAGGKDFWCC